jgi:putative peptidoglycan lipid II flippase
VDKGKSASVGERIIRASFVVAAAHLCFKFLGLAQSIFAGAYFGDADFDIVYVVAFEGVILTLFLIGEEVIIPAFLPVFMKLKEEEGEGAAWAAANILLTAQAIVLLIVVCLMVCFPDSVINLVTDWKETGDSTRYLLAQVSVVYLAPALFFLSLGSTTYLLLNGYKRFFLAALGDASWKFCVVVSLVIGVGKLELGWKALIFGLVVGSVAKLVTHLIGLLRQLRFTHLSINLKHPAVKAFLVLALPLLLGIIFAKFRDVFNNVYILSTLDTPGLMKANSFGRKLFLAMSWMVPYAVSIAMLPFFCELVDKGDKKKLGEILTKAGRMMLAFFIPVALLTAVLSEPIAQLLFKWGKFGQETVHWAAISNACYILVLPAFALEYILMQGFFANRKMWSVVIIGIASSMVSILISYIFIAHLGYRGVQGLMVVALGYVAARNFKTLLLISVLKRHIPMFDWKPTLLFVLRCTLVGVVVALAGYFALKGISGVLPAAEGRMIKIQLLIKLAVSGTVGGAIFFAGIYVMRITEPRDMFDWGMEKVKQKLDKSKSTASESNDADPSE